MNVFELLVGKKMEIETDMKVMVELEIKSVEPKGHSREITPSTRDNDWWERLKLGIPTLSNLLMVQIKSSETLQILT